jgi:hypothetical protein
MITFIPDDDRAESMYSIEIALGRSQCYESTRETLTPDKVLKPQSEFI